MRWRWEPPASREEATERICTVIEIFGIVILIAAVATYLNGNHGSQFVTGVVLGGILVAVGEFGMRFFRR